MKKIYFLMMMAATLFVLGCGGGEDDEEKTPPTPTPVDNGGNGSGNNGQNNNNSSESDSVQVKCYTCFGSTKCSTCNGTGKGCKQCNGTGKGCKECNGTGLFCDNCNSTGKCPSRYCIEGNCYRCNGDTKVTCYTCNGSGKIWGGREMVTCPTCHGNRKVYCSSCGGTGKCDLCKGKNICTVCNGDPKCKTCKGSGYCALCGGDGHCPDCKNSDGKCVTCGGTGYTKEKKGTPNPEEEYLTASPSTVEFVAEGESKIITVSANIDWKIELNTASSWLTVKKSSNDALLVEATSNIPGRNRSATITLKGRSKSAEISVMQEGDNKTREFTVGGVTFNMIYVEGGTFQMGSDESYNQQPIHAVTVSTFSIGETEVTQALWKAVMGSNPSYYSWDGINSNQRPVENISWNDCQDFISKLNQKTGKNFRLPTEAEWEFAARGGVLSKGYIYAGSNNIGEVAWYMENSTIISQWDYNTEVVATKKANELGIYDMSGNVKEWCSDWFDYNYYSSSPSTNPQGPDSGDRRVLRGGAMDQGGCSVTWREFASPDYKHRSYGVRLVLP